MTVQNFLHIACFNKKWSNLSQGELSLEMWEKILSIAEILKEANFSEVLKDLRLEKLRLSLEHKSNLTMFLSSLVLGLQPYGLCPAAV